MTSRLQQTVATLGLLLWVAAPIGGLVILSIEDAHAQLAAPEPAAVPVNKDEAPRATSVDVALEWLLPPAAVAPSWTGTVQQVLIRAGETVNNGTPIVVIDGVARVTWATPGAFYRTIGAGAEGADIAWLKAILESYGLEQSASSKCNDTCVRGIRRVAAQLGVPDPSHVAAFDPAWVIYIPTEGAVVNSTALVVGDAAPAQGSPIVTFDAQLNAANVVASGTERMLTAGAESEGLDPARWRAAIADSLVSIPPDAVLTYEGNELALDASRTALDRSTWNLLPKSSDVLSVPAIFAVPAPKGQFTVPAAAIRAGINGETCVVVGDEVTRVTVVDSQSGLTTVTGDLFEGSYVTAPVPEGISCQ